MLTEEDLYKLGVNEDFEEIWTFKFIEGTRLVIYRIKDEKDRPYRRG